MADTPFQTVFLPVQCTPGIAIAIPARQRKTAAEVGAEVHFHSFQRGIVQIHVQFTGLDSVIFVTGLEVYFSGRNQIVDFVDVSAYGHIQTLSGIFDIGGIIIMVSGPRSGLPILSVLPFIFL